jgi:3-oxoadipate enol-lactonase
MLRFGTVRTRQGNELSTMAMGPDGDRAEAPVLFVHPLNLRKECWLDVIRLLAVDRPCVAVDLTGHGESNDAGAYDLAGWVTDCREVATAWGLGRFHVVGGSLGGTVALCAAAEAPAEVLSVVTMGASVGDEESDTASLIRMLDTMAVDDLFALLAEEAVAPGSSAELVETVRALTNSHGKAVVRSLLEAAASADATAWLPKVRCPVLVLSGEHDTAFPAEVGERLASRVGGSHEVLPGVGHLPMLEAAAALTERLVRQLDSAEAKAGVL